MLPRNDACIDDAIPDAATGREEASDGAAAIARAQVLALLREALAIIDDELDEDVVGAKLSECIERLAEGEPAAVRDGPTRA